jgi:hypothetical protein
MRSRIVLALGLALFAAGCSQSNEGEAQITGTAPTGTTAAPPATQQGYEQYMQKQQQQSSTNYASQGYPGAR